MPSLKVGASELSGEALFRVDRSGTPTITVNIDAAKIDLAGLRAAPAAAPVPATPPPQRRVLPSTPFQASWLGRSTLSVTARVGELTGPSAKITNGSVTLASSEKRFTFRGAASVGNGSASFDLVYDPAGRYRPDDARPPPRARCRWTISARCWASISGSRMPSATSISSCAAAAAAPRRR